VGDERAFAAGAVKLAGFAGAVLGWPPDTFWRATPAELEAVVLALKGADGEGDEIGFGNGAAPPDAATIARLREAYPDG